MVNARRSRTVLTAAIIAAVEQVPHLLRYLAQELWLSQPKVLKVFPDSQLHKHNKSTCISRQGGSPVHQYANYTSINLPSYSQSPFSSHLYPTVL